MLPTEAPLGPETGGAAAAATDPPSVGMATAPSGSVSLPTGSAATAATVAAAMVGSLFFWAV